jgi:hypothetical protein
MRRTMKEGRFRIRGRVKGVNEQANSGSDDG